MSLTQRLKVWLWRRRAEKAREKVKQALTAQGMLPARPPRWEPLPQSHALAQVWFASSVLSDLGSHTCDQSSNGTTECGTRSNGEGDGE